MVNCLLRPRHILCINFMKISNKPSMHKLLLSMTLLGLPLCQQAYAGVTYQLRQVQAGSGETINIDAIVFNDTDSVMNWSAPAHLVLQWRDNQGQIIRSLAERDSSQASASLPVNTFSKFSWRAVVPSGVRGLQALNIEGEPVILALDTNPQSASPLTATVAHTAVIDAGAANNANGRDPELPAAQVAAIGVNPESGPGIRTEALQTTDQGFRSFRDAIGAHDPTYFIVGSRGGSNARFQISFRYRLHSPADPLNPKFFDHFYMGYTQTALWDLHADSKPFVDTTYSPSLFWHKDSMWESAGKSVFAGLAAGYEHASNGKAGDDSRSMNDFFIQPELNYRFDDGAVLSFRPRLKAYVFMNENADYRDYMGRIDWNLRYARHNGLVLSGRYTQGSDGRKSKQVAVAWPLKRTPLNMNGYLYGQYYSGYGETMLHYRSKAASQFRVGLALVP